MKPWPSRGCVSGNRLRYLDTRLSSSSNWPFKMVTGRCFIGWMSRKHCRGPRKSLVQRRKFTSRSRRGPTVRVLLPLTCNHSWKRFEDCLVLKSRSEEHTSELQSLTNLVCRLLLEKKNKK